MSQENVEFGRRRLGRRNRCRVSVSVAALVGLACALLAAVPAGAVAGTVFQQVTVVPSDARLGSDGVRFVRIRRFGSGAPWVFDTLAGRSFQPMPPSPDCQYVHDGGGLVLWGCFSTGRYMLSDLATGAAREPAGWAAVEAMERPYIGCSASRVGRHWLEVVCGPSLGPQHDPVYLNHRTGRLIEHPSGFYIGDPRIDLDYAELIRRRCAPLERARLDTYLPPFGLELSISGYLNVEDDEFRYREIRLRRCGRQRAEIVSRCPSRNCVVPQLGSRYLTWAEGARVFAYLPRIRRSVLVGRAPAKFRDSGRPRQVVHTCQRVFARWGRIVYVARFQPRRGAPLCQTRSRARGSTAVP